jgi:hypothetical protein
MRVHAFSFSTRGMARRAALALSAATPALLGTAYAASTSSTATGTLYVTASSYAGTAETLTVGEPLPISPVVDAIDNGAYPNVFFNDTVDGNFGVGSPIELIAAPVAYGAGGGVFTGQETRIDVTKATGIVTSFSSKSELGVHLSTDGSALTFTGYAGAINELDISNANTSVCVDGTNSDVQTNTYRSVVQYNLATGTFTAPTSTTAYSGNNMRGAILAPNVNGTGKTEYLLVGNAGNGSGTEITCLVQDTGVQIATPGMSLTTTVGVQQGTPGSSNGFQYGYSVTQNGDAADKSGKDDNFRGIAVYNNTLYVTKGSGSNGIDTGYQVGNAGTLPDAANAATTPVAILPGFPTTLAKSATASTQYAPFDIWFANANTLYVADEGVQALPYTANPHAGLEKWTYNGSTWSLAYTIQNGLSLGVPYSVAGYPTNLNPFNTGLRHLTGVVTGNSVVLYATTSTYSSAGDPGADPNAIVEVVDQLNATTLPANEAFSTVAAPFNRNVYRGVLFVPSAQ